MIWMIIHVKYYGSLEWELREPNSMIFGCLHGWISLNQWCCTWHSKACAFFVANKFETCSEPLLFCWIHRIVMNYAYLGNYHTTMLNPYHIHIFHIIYDLDLRTRACSKMPQPKFMASSVGSVKLLPHFIFWDPLRVTVLPQDVWSTY